MSIQSVDRALNIISLFSMSQPSWGIAEIAKALAISQPTVHALVKTLVGQNFLEQDPDTKKYRLGLRLYEYGTVAAAQLKINQIGAGPAAALVIRTGLAVRLAVLDGNHVVVTCNFTPQPQSLQFRLSVRTPIYCSAMGKAILAQLPDERIKEYIAHCNFRPYTPYTISSGDRLMADLEETRKRGYSIDNEEYMLGFSCVASVIFDQTNTAFGAASLSGEPGFLKDKTFSTRVHELISLSSEISGTLGYSF